MILSRKTYNYFSEKQDKLDHHIMSEKDILYKDWYENYGDKHETALRVELAEFINECSDLWKYWKDAEPNKERILDEAVDVIHFVFLHINKRSAFINVGESYDLYREHDKAIRHLRDFNNNKISLNAVLTFDLKRDYIEQVLALVLTLLDEYNFTEEDVINQYNAKNKVNFERLESGY